MPEQYLAWWNLENLFDEEDAPPDRRPDKVRRAIAEDVVGWTAQLRDYKIAQRASVIGQMNDGAGPDLLGVCEVENRFVVILLVDELAGRRRAAAARWCTPIPTTPAVSTSRSCTTRTGSRSRHTRRPSTWSCAATPPGRSCGSTSAPGPAGGRGWCSATTDPCAAGDRPSRPATGTSPGRRCPTSTSALEVHGRTPRCCRWGTSTTSRSTPASPCTR